MPYKTIRVYDGKDSIIVKALTLKLAFLKLAGLKTDDDKLNFLILSEAIRHLSS